MKYPDKDVGPETQAELMAWLFGMLASAYNLLAQYEADERQRDQEQRMAAFDNLRTKSYPKAPDPEQDSAKPQSEDPMAPDLGKTRGGR